MNPPTMTDRILAAIAQAQAGLDSVESKLSRVVTDQQANLQRIGMLEARMLEQERRVRESHTALNYRQSESDLQHESELGAIIAHSRNIEAAVGDLRKNDKAQDVKLTSIEDVVKTSARTQGAKLEVLTRQRWGFILTALWLVVQLGHIVLSLFKH